LKEKNSGNNIIFIFIKLKIIFGYIIIIEKNIILLWENINIKFYEKMKKKKLKNYKKYIK